MLYCCRVAAITAADWFEEISHSPLRAGARGYVLKDSAEEEVYAIRAVGRTEDIFSPAVATGVLAYFAASPLGGDPPQAFPTLTDREREILILIAQGHPNPSIARQLS